VLELTISTTSCLGTGAVASETGEKSSKT